MKKTLIIFPHNTLMHCHVVWADFWPMGVKPAWTSLLLTVLTSLTSMPRDIETVTKQSLLIMTALTPVILITVVMMISLELSLAVVAVAAIVVLTVRLMLTAYLEPNVHVNAQNSTWISQYHLNIVVWKVVIPGMLRRGWNRNIFQSCKILKK